MKIVLKTPFPYILGRSLKVLTKIMPKTKLNPWEISKNGDFK